LNQINKMNKEAFGEDTPLFNHYVVYRVCGVVFDVLQLVQHS